MKVYLPWLGEFGSELLRWVPRINADRSNKIVCFERGKECLYPTGNKYVVPRVPETDRKCAGALTQGAIFENIRNYLGPKYEYLSSEDSATISNKYKVGIFEPRTKDYGFECDVVVFPRWRHNTKRLNWEQWPEFVQTLIDLGYAVFAAGHPDSSFKVRCPSAGDYDNPLEASIWAIKHSKVRIGMMTALCVLSLYCAKQPWILLTETGMKCNIGVDGPNTGYLEFADYKGVGWKYFNFLNDYKLILPYIDEALCGSGLLYQRRRSLSLGLQCS